MLVPRTKLLVVDDEDVVREVTQGMLEALGYEVLTAASGMEAIKLYAEQASQIALVLLDMAMPVMDGEKTLEQLRQLDPQTKVIFSSGYLDSGVAQRHSDRTAVGYIQKPYSVDLLELAVKKALTRFSDEV